MSTARLSSYVIASNYAEDVLAQNPRIKDVDRAHMKTLLTTAINMEQPIQQLPVAISDCDNYYSVTITGYTRIGSDRAWNAAFLGKTRTLECVTNTYTQYTERGWTKIIHMTKTRHLGTLLEDQEYGDDGKGKAISKDVISGANELADTIIAEHTNIRIADKPYVKAVLVAAVLIESDVKTFAIAINDDDQYYKVAIKGYTQFINDRVWNQTFLGKSRGVTLDCVVDTFNQNTEDGPVKVIHISKIKFQNTETASARRYRKRE